jgi:hypothetical protein
MNVVSAASLLICAATLVLCTRSFWLDDYAQCTVHLQSGCVTYTAESIRGTFELSITRLPGVLSSPNPAMFAIVPARWNRLTQAAGSQPAYYPAALWRFGLKQSIAGLAGTGPGRVGVFGPAWPVILAFACCPAWHILRRRETEPMVCTFLRLRPPCDASPLPGMWNRPHSDERLKRLL